MEGNFAAKNIVSVANQRVYLRALLKSQGLSCDALHVICTAIVLSVVTYAPPSFVGQLSKGDRARLDSLFRKAFSLGFCSLTFSSHELILAADKKSFRQMCNTEHCLHPLLPKHTNSKTRKLLRNRGHDYTLLNIETNFFFFFYTFSLVCDLSCLIMYLFYRYLYFNIFAFMCLFV